MDEIYSCLHYTSADFTSSTPPPQPQPPSHHHHPLLLSPLPPPSYSSLISPDDDFASFRDHYTHHRNQPMFGSEPSSFFSFSSSMSDAASAVVTEINQDGDFSSALKARIAVHPLYPRLVEAYIDCQKVGAPPEMSNLLDEIQRDKSISAATAMTSCFGVDPELDEFMESYCDMLSKYRSDLAKPFHEATSYLHNMEAQLSSLCNYNTSHSHVSDEAAGSSEEDVSGGESADVMEFLPNGGEDQELKDKLLRKYSGYISSLKHEFSKKKKKGKLPKDAKQTLLGWWSDHYKWPYPTEADKIALAECTGLDQKQINNWFINQRKRHWKPSENMQFMEMDGLSGPFYANN